MQPQFIFILQYTVWMLTAFIRKDTVMPIPLKTIASTDWY